MDLEAWGVRLVESMVRRFRASGLTVPSGGRIPEGPHFHYNATPSLFLGRVGRGPLRVAWDTNLLIDYFDHGAALWEGEPLAYPLVNEHTEELEGLQVLVAAWVLRDIRFEILLPTLGDSKTPLANERRAMRRKAWDEFQAALSHTTDGNEEDADGEPWPWRALNSVLRRVPEGHDRLLIEVALRRGAHVFLTRDQGILKAREWFRPFGLLILSPQDMVEQLGAAGVLHAFVHPEFLYWPLPDQERVAHLITALSAAARPTESQ